MKKNLRYLALAAVGTVAAMGISSCTYDPYHSGTAVSGSYSSGGYGHGYGYGGSSFSTSVFVGTGDPRWGYDPHTYSYYDYHRRAYYDPYLHGYYPVGYRPPIVYGVPHPYGWSHGHGHIRPPSHVTNVTVVNYRNRESAYRNTNYGWSKQVRQGPIGAERVAGRRPPQNYNDRTGSQNYQPRPDSYRSRTDTRNGGSRYQDFQPSRQHSPKPAVREENRERPNRYNTPVNHQQAQPRQERRTAQPREDRRYEERQEHRSKKQKDKDDKNDNYGRAKR